RTVRPIPKPSNTTWISRPKPTSNSTSAWLPASIPANAPARSGAPPRRNAGTWTILCRKINILIIFAHSIYNHTMPKQSDVLSADFLVKAAEQFGTPVYVYHAEKIKIQYEKLQNAFSKADARFFYAC